MKYLENNNEPEYKDLYTHPLKSSRGSVLYRAFSYPTKISPETIALFIASHTDPGDTILDTFSGSGTTGLATILLEKPSKKLLKMAEIYGLNPKWGKRKAILYEISALGSFISQVLCNPPEPNRFLSAAKKLISLVEDELGYLYEAKDENSEVGKIRYIVWTDLVICPHCKSEVPFWDSSVSLNPANISQNLECTNCHRLFKKDEADFVIEEFQDKFLNQKIFQRKRQLAYVFGHTGKSQWARKATQDDIDRYMLSYEVPYPESIPEAKIDWGDLYRSGYHFGISHVHHFYTNRNLIIMGKLFDKIQEFPKDIQPSLRLLALSYNSSHSTLMTRIVAKKNQKKLSVTGAQTGVLYISSLPVEKNILEGLRRKMKTISSAFSITYGHNCDIQIANLSSESMDLKNGEIDYVFTDPPFGDFIPYAEINFLNEVWLRRITDASKEIIISNAQKKSVNVYGSMIEKVFSEIARVLKPDGKMTLIFHSGKSQIWNELINALSSSRLHVLTSSILDKVQTSFKQQNSTIAVQGDPVILVSNREENLQNPEGGEENFSHILLHLIQEAQNYGTTTKVNERWLYSRYVGYCLENGLQAPMDASEFYSLAKSHLQTHG